MQIEPYHSQQFPTEWTGGRLIIEKWLAQRCSREGLMQFVSGVAMVIAGLVALVVTSGVIAAIVLVVVAEISGLLGIVGFNVSLLKPLPCLVVFGIIMAFSVAYAWKTRRDSPAVPRVNFETSAISATNLLMEFIAAGPIFMVLAAQDFYKFARLTRMDIPHVSAVLLWLYDKNNHAGFAEISLAFPGLNAVRVLPQLRDVAGVYWWPDKGEIALSVELRKLLEGILGRKPRSASAYRKTAPGREPAASHFPGVSAEVLSWYTALNLPPFATLQQVKSRYRKLAKIHHPDAQARNGPVGVATDEEKMKRINEAYHNIVKHSQRQAGGFGE